jgi:myo-inositol 2-dehydrogenase/D-chiro-inositol 1-dehydrogenase
VVGLGAVAQAVHLPLLAKHADLFAPVAVCDVSRSTRTSIGARAGLAEERQFASAEAMLAGAELDALAILTPGSHGALAAAAARAGLAVFCEKPLAYTLAEADELASLEPRLMLGYMKLYDPAVEHARRLLGGRPGPRSVEVTVLHPSSAAQLAHVELLPAPSDVDPAVRTAFAAAESAAVERALGPVPPTLATLYTEVLLGSVVHDLAVLRYLLGGPLEVHDVEAWPEETAEGSLALTGSLPGGARVSIRWHYLEDYPAYREEVRVHDDRGTVALEFPSPYLLHAPTVLTVDDTKDGLARSATFRSTAEAFERQWLAFARFAFDGAAPRAGIAEGRADIVACQQAAARLAARSDLPIGGEAGVQVAATNGSADRPAAVGDEQMTGAEATKEGKS